MSGLSRDDQIAEQGVSLNRYEYRQYAPVTWIVLRPTLETICSDHVGGFGSLERVLDFVIFRVFRILAFPRCCHVLAKNSSRFNYNKRTTIVDKFRRDSGFFSQVVYAVFRKQFLRSRSSYLPRKPHPV